MTVYDLTRDQLIELKQSILCEHGCLSYGELADADEIVSDNAVYSEFDNYDFSTDDFFCTAGQ